MREAAPTILFAPASGPGVGGGHVMRCLALASVISERGGRPVFVVGEAGRRIVERFAEAPVDLACVKSTRMETIAAAIAAHRPQALVVDDYALDADQERAWREAVLVLAAIDDLADRRHLADLLIDPGYGRVAADYAGLTP